MHDEKIFFIGFNKTATTALHRLMQKSGIPSVHWDKGQLAADIEERISDKPELQRYLARSTAFSDIVAFSGTDLIEGNRHFRIYEEIFPRAFFVFNDRNVEDWIVSRRRHSGGSFLRRCMAIFSADEERTVAIWRDTYERHKEAVLSHFSGSPRFLHFRVDRDPVDNLIRLLSPSYAVSASDWGVHRKTPV